MTMPSWWDERAGLHGTVAIITGGAGGLGEAISTDLAANGVRLAIVDRDEEAVERIAAVLDDRDAIVQLGDAREPEVLDALFAAADQRWARLDTLVNVVGGTFRAPFSEQGPRAWDALVRSNFTYVLHATSRAIPAMRAGARGGSIVNVTTIEGHRGAPNFAVYSAAKAAVAQFSRTLAVELARDRIRVNCVAPDMVPTPNMLGIRDGDPAGHAMLDPVSVGVSIPMGRLGVPADVSSVVVFLASDLSSYVTGTTVHVDGGTYASSGWLNWPQTGYANALPPDVSAAVSRHPGVDRPEESGHLHP